MTPVRRGFALPAALWMVAAFATIALHFGLLARNQRLATNRSSELLLTRTAIESSFRVRLKELSDQWRSGDVVDPWHRYHGLVAMFQGPDSITVITRFFDESALIHPQGMDVGRLSHFFRALEPDTALADSAAQWVRSHTGATVEIPGCAGAGWLDHSDGYEEVRQVLRRAAPLMSCVGTARINVRTAPAPVLASLPGMSEAGIAAITAQQRETKAGNVLDIARHLRGRDRDAFLAAVPALLGSTTSETTHLYLRLEARLNEIGAWVILEAVVAGTPTGTSVVWRRYL